MLRRGNAGILCAALVAALFSGCHSSGSGTGGASSSRSVTVSISAGIPVACVDLAKELESRKCDLCFRQCEQCVEANCCPELMAALGDTKNANVAACMQTQCLNTCYPTKFPSNPNCQAPSKAPSMGACVKVGGAIQCNPVTNEPCPPGAACGESNGGFVCYPDGNTQAMCQPCGANNMYCGGGLACATNTCVRYCCTDADCGLGGTCVTGEFVDATAVGTCGNDNTSSSSSSSTSASTGSFMTSSSSASSTTASSSSSTAGAGGASPASATSASSSGGG